jgi:hypothetical protein
MTAEKPEAPSTSPTKSRSQASALTRLVLELLGEFVAHDSNMHQVSLKVGPDRHFLSRRLANERMLTVEELFETLEALDIPTEVFLRALTLRLPQAPPLEILEKVGIADLEISAFEVASADNATALRQAAAQLANVRYFGEALTLLERAFVGFALGQESQNLGLVLVDKAKILRKLARNRAATWKRAGHFALVWLGASKRSVARAQPNPG